MLDFALNAGNSAQGKQLELAQDNLELLELLSCLLSYVALSIKLCLRVANDHLVDSAQVRKLVHILQDGDHAEVSNRAAQIVAEIFERRLA